MASMPFLSCGFASQTQEAVDAGSRGAHARLKPGCIYRTYQACSMHALLFFEQQPSTGCFTAPHAVLGLWVLRSKTNENIFDFFDLAVKNSVGQE
jgi:hypothetical protein